MTNEASQILNELGQMIIEDAAFSSLDWDGISIVIKFNEKDDSSLFGYSYSANGDWSAQTPKSFDVLRKFVELREAMAKPEEADWKTCLLQIKRPGPKMQIQFDYKDAGRWAVTPDNVLNRVNELRPV